MGTPSSVHIPAYQGVVAKPPEWLANVEAVKPGKTGTACRWWSNAEVEYSSWCFKTPLSNFH